MSITQDTDRMTVEHERWLRVGAELDRIGIDINADTSERIVRAIELWAETLVTLRMGQAVRVKNAALRDAVARWNRAVAKS